MSIPMVAVTGCRCARGRRGGAATIRVCRPDAGRQRRRHARRCSPRSPALPPAAVSAACARSTTLRPPTWPSLPDARRAARPGTGTTGMRCRTRPGSSRIPGSGRQDRAWARIGRASSAEPLVRLTAELGVEPSSGRAGTRRPGRSWIPLPGAWRSTDRPPRPAAAPPPLPADRWTVGRTGSACRRGNPPGNRPGNRCRPCRPCCPNQRRSGRFPRSGRRRRVSRGAQHLFGHLGQDRFAQALRPLARVGVELDQQPAVVEPGSADRAAP